MSAAAEPSDVLSLPMKDACRPGRRVLRCAVACFAKYFNHNALPTDHDDIVYEPGNSSMSVCLKCGCKQRARTEAANNVRRAQQCRPDKPHTALKKLQFLYFIGMGSSKSFNF